MFSLIGAKPFFKYTKFIKERLYQSCPLCIFFCKLSAMFLSLHLVLFIAPAVANISVTLCNVASNLGLGLLLLLLSVGLPVANAPDVLQPCGLLYYP